MVTRCTSLNIGVNANLYLVNKFCYLFCYFAFSASTLLLGQEEGIKLFRPVKKLISGALHGYLSEMRYRF